MKIYAAGETVCRRLLGLPQAVAEWVVTGADHDDMVRAGFIPASDDATRFRHQQTGDIYRLARRQETDDESGKPAYRTGRSVTLADELATRPLTILAMAANRQGQDDEIIDPFDAETDIADGRLRHVSALFAHNPENLLIIALWAARLSKWGFSTAHGTYGLMKKMVSDGVVADLARQSVAEKTLQALDSERPSEYFRVLQRCGALAVIAPALNNLYQQAASHRSQSLPQVMRLLDDERQASPNISNLLKVFHDGLGDDADTIIDSLGLGGLFSQQG